MAFGYGVIWRYQ